MNHEPPKPTPPSSPRRVLVVDDDVALAAMAAKILERIGLEVVQAHSAEEALMEARSPARFDLLFTDVVMGNRTGLELAALLRADHPHLGILITTGQFDAAVRRSVERSGHHVLRKPYTAHALGAAIELALAVPDRGTP